MRHVKIPYWLVIKKYWSRLLPVSLIWFIYDFSAYSFGIYSSTILDRVIPDTVTPLNLFLKDLLPLTLLSYKASTACP